MLAIVRRKSWRKCERRNNDMSIVLVIDKDFISRNKESLNWIHSFFQTFSFTLAWFVLQNRHLSPNQQNHDNQSCQDDPFAIRITRTFHTIHAQIILNLFYIWIGNNSGISSKMIDVLTLILLISLGPSEFLHRILHKVYMWMFIGQRHKPI